MSPRKVAGGFRIGIPNVVAETIDLKAVDFARQHYYKKGKTRAYCVLCRELNFKIGRDGLGAYSNNINVDKAGKWRGTKISGRCV